MKFQPNKENAIMLNSSFQLQLKTCLVDLIDQIGDFDKNLETNKILDLVKSKLPEEFNGFDSFGYHEAVALCESGSVYEGLSAIKNNSSVALDELYLNFKSKKHLDFQQRLYSSAAAGKNTPSHQNYNLEFNVLSSNQVDEKIIMMDKGLGYLNNAVPDLFNETKEIIKNIGFFSSDEDETYFCLSMTGNIIQSLILINAVKNVDWIDCLDKYIHEGAHTILFLLNLNNDLVLNPEEEKYPSPLREDLRHMPGIYHATFVIQRLIYAFEKIRLIEALSCQEVAKIDELLSFYRVCEARGFSTVMEFGKLSNMGADLISDGHSYVDVDVVESVA